MAENDIDLEQLGKEALGAVAKDVGSGLDTTPKEEPEPDKSDKGTIVPDSGTEGTGKRDEAEGAEVAGEGEGEPEPVRLRYKKSGRDEEYALDPETRLAKKDEEFVRQLLSKQGLEESLQREVETHKLTRKQAEALRVQIEEEQLKYAREIEPVRAILELTKDPQFVTVVNAFRKRQNQPAWTYDAEKAELKVKVERAERESIQREVNNFYDGIGQELVASHGFTEEAVQKVSDYAAKKGLGFLEGGENLDRQRERIIDQLKIARDALIRQGELPDPDKARIQADLEHAKKEAERAEERARVRNPVAGGKVSSRGKGAGAPELRGISTDEYVEIYKRQNRLG